ncbi:hypothetical protein [Streptomyces sp. NPDC015131]|uniref:hypothetical protein n=1 Tax=Streptomyces sp. NPDC015131 TaxID=3364941 RepID=UPI0036F7BFF5
MSYLMPAVPGKQYENENTTKDYCFVVLSNRLAEHSKGDHVCMKLTQGEADSLIEAGHVKVEQHPEPEAQDEAPSPEPQDEADEAAAAEAGTADEAGTPDVVTPHAGEADGEAEIEQGRDDVATPHGSDHKGR